MSRAEMDVPAVEPKSQQQGELRKLKRSRVALACHRCRTRKQKVRGRLHMVPIGVKLIAMA